MKLRFCVLGSGSSGNATLIEGGGARLLLDAGLGARELAERLESAGVDPASLDAVLISHEHGDHARGAASFSRRFGVPLTGTAGTEAALGLDPEKIPRFQRLLPGDTHRYGEALVRPVAVPHDAREPVAFVVEACGRRLGHATDLGHMTRGLVAAFRHCDALLIESNHDPALLRQGPYPWSLKERILGPLGHLSNRDVARYLHTGLGSECRTVVLAHLSEKNNHPELVRAEAERALGRRRVRVELTTRTGCDWIELPAAVDAPRSVAPSGGDQMRLF
jgi:phosphoribosyl 1,2-cyclic phosphodiesterase